MKERPIIFSAPMVRAILDGRKTQTRRLCKAMNAWVDQECREVRQHDGAPHHFIKGASLPLEKLRCPYGVPGDRLWVREAWQAFFADEVPADRPRGPRHTMGIPAQPERESFVFYRADGDLSHPEDGSEAIWLSPLHMPRRASRITLEVVSVRVERVQEISEEDALAEGALEFDGPTTFVDNGMQSIYFPNMGYARAAFTDLWESIHGPDSWAANPWVWVIEFQREETTR